MRIALTGGDYKAKSLIANAQRCLNLYPEANPPGSTVPFTYYPRPGLKKLATAPVSGYRCLYTASNGKLYAVVGQNIYAVSQAWQFTLLGSVVSTDSRVSMADNGTDILAVDGSSTGYVIHMADNAFKTISGGAFYGADYVQYVDTFFVLNKPGTPIMYISLSESTEFDPLDFASKTGNPDNIVGVQIMHREAWLIGTYASEIWYNTGAADFTFGPVPGAYIEHGCCAPYSIAKQDMSVYWLSLDMQGHLMVIEGNGYKANRISTHALETEIQSYGTYADARGSTYQFEGHTLYELTFPTADKTWVYDVANGLWHEESWTDDNGVQHRNRANVRTFAYGQNIAGGWENGDLYAADPETYTDDGQPIVFLRSFPHIEKDGKRLFHRQFIADMQVGTAAGTIPDNPPMVSLRWSDTRGASWANAIEQSMGAAGEYLTSMQFQRLGMARDRVYELSWSAPFKTALNGAWLDARSAAT